MRSGSPCRESGLCRKGFRSRRLVSYKPKDSRPASAKSSEDSFMRSREIDRSFRRSAYPNVAEVFRLSEEMDLPPSKIKAEFSKRRQCYRRRNRLPEDALVHPCFLPVLAALATFLHSQQTMLKSAVLWVSVATLWCTQFIRTAGRSLTVELMTLNQ